MQKPVGRELRPRTAEDCPECQAKVRAGGGLGMTRPTVRPWREVRSRRGRKKEVETDGQACWNKACAYYGIADGQVHALVGYGGHGRGERIRDLYCQACQTKLNTAFVERVNLTIRQGVSELIRRTWGVAQTVAGLKLHLERWRGYYHFVRPHESLRVKLNDRVERGGRRLPQRYRQRTPAMAAGLTHHPWSIVEVTVQSVFPPHARD